MGNMKNLSNIMEGYSPYKELREQTKGLVKKWESTGLLEGLNSESEVHGMSVLLENQARQLIDESSKAGTDTNSEQWSGVALPLVRKVFGEIAAKDFVSVQPMNLPSGLVFYLEFKYGTAQAGHTKGNSVFGTTDTADTDATGGLYGAGAFGYSINDVDNLNGNSQTLEACTSASLSDVNFDPELSASVAAGTLKKVTIKASELPKADLEGVRGFEISGSKFNAAGTYYPAYTKSDTSGNAIFIVEGSAAGVDVASVLVKYHKAPEDNSRGDFEDQFTSVTTSDYDGGDVKDIDIPEIDIQMTSKPIVAKTRKLKAVWTPELAQDLNAYHSVDAEAELTSMLSEYISMEIDLEILDMLIQNTVTTDYWSARVGYEYDSAIKSTVGSSTGQTTGGFALGSGDGAPMAYQKSSWFETLGVKIQKVSNKIHQKTMRGGANFLVCGPDVATIIESIPGFTADTDGDKNNFAMGVQKVGSYANRFQVYKNPYMKENVILMGYRGSNFLETGAVYAPYIPLIMTPLVYDPVNFTPRKGVMTRYAKKIVRPEFYGKIIVGDLNFV